MGNSVFKTTRFYEWLFLITVIRKSGVRNLGTDCKYTHVQHKCESLDGVYVSYGLTTLTLAHQLLLADYQMERVLTLNQPSSTIDLRGTHSSERQFCMD